MSDEWEHVILLSADALRADHLSCYGYERETSPVLDELAEESIQFTNAYSASSHTREAVPALLTGEYPDVAIDENYHLATKPIAERLSEAGFATGGFHSNPFVSRAYGFDRGFDEFDDDLHLGQHKLIALAQRALDKLRNRHYARAEEINERVLSWIDSLDSEERFFCWAHYLDTHGPYEPPGEYRTVYADRKVSDREAQSLYKRAIKDPDSITEEERQLLIDLYDAEIRYNDERIGEFLEALRERELLEDTLLVFTSDHGDAFGEHGYFEHPRYLHEEITHVPLLVRPPGGAEGTVSTPASTLDATATIREAARGEASLDGTSLFDVTDEARIVYQQARGEDEHSHVRRYALRDGEGSCFCERDTRDDSIEIGECDNDTLKEAMQSFVLGRDDTGNSEIGTNSQDVDNEVEQRLDALGYK